MLYNLDWLEPGNAFPPTCEQDRITRYMQNAKLFDGDHFGDPEFRTHDGVSCDAVQLYQKCAQRISRVVGNFEDIISFPVLLNYQRLMTLKMADLVCGEYPTITGATPRENAALRDVRDTSDADSKLFSTVIDMSRYGDALWRVYKDWDGRNNFTCWDPSQWFPIVRQDGTNSIEMHCICWRENISNDPDKQDWKLHVQIHPCDPEMTGYYESRVYAMDETGGTILALESSEQVATGLDTCAITHLTAFNTTNSVYGYDDYMPIDSILAEIMTRIGQISIILDKHADPSITGPASALRRNPETGELYLETGKYFAVSEGDITPQYMTWDGHLEAAFKHLEFLINQLYILSEMGAALLGGQDGSSQAISGTSMRFKMVNPLAKARRISNALTRPVRKLFSVLSTDAEIDEDMFTDLDSDSNDQELTLPIPYRKISVRWADGLPDDPRENIENCKLVTGETHMMPLEQALIEFFGKSSEEARQWVQQIKEEHPDPMQVDPNKPGPQDGTGVNPAKKGSETSLGNFHSPTNGEA